MPLRSHWASFGFPLAALGSRLLPLVRTWASICSPLGRFGYLGVPSRFTWKLDPGCHRKNYDCGPSGNLHLGPAGPSDPGRVVQEVLFRASHPHE